MIGSVTCGIHIYIYIYIYCELHREIETLMVPIDLFPGTGRDSCSDR